ncbi:DUF2812 domain-containing protein [Lachnospiraceae bacterium]|nr:DUF2812 domain-containing protein [Lachnospiraceae bacterium]
MIRHKLFFTNITKEENWINRTIAQGYRLEQVIPGRYKFQKLTDVSNLPLVRIDYRTFSSQEQFTDYLTLYEDYGWRHIAGNRSEGIQYFEKTRADCQEEIFSDSISKASRYRRIFNLQIALFAVNLSLLVIMFCTGLFHLPSFSNWKELYYTPGLWQMNGGQFLLAFLFETPFAIGRAFGGLASLLFFIIVVCFGFFGCKAFYHYWKEKKL